MHKETLPIVTGFVENTRCLLENKKKNEYQEDYVDVHGILTKKLKKIMLNPNRNIEKITEEINQNIQFILEKEKNTKLKNILKKSKIEIKKEQITRGEQECESIIIHIEKNSLLVNKITKIKKPQKKNNNNYGFKKTGT